MKLQKILKIISFVFPTFLFFSGAIFLSAYYAGFVVNVQNVDVTLGSSESSNTEFSVSFDPAFTYYVTGKAPYYIAPRSHCNQYNNNWNCVDSAPNLCPYLALEPKNEEVTEIGFTQNPFGFPATGEINRPIDEIDNWNLVVKSPCFEGECSLD